MPKSFKKNPAHEDPSSGAHTIDQHESAPSYVCERVGARAYVGEQSAWINFDLECDVRNAPYIVQIKFSKEKIWHIAFDLLDQGQSKPAGINDVQVQPCTTEQGMQGIQIILTSGSDSVRLEFLAKKLEDFIARVMEARQANGMTDDKQMSALIRQQLDEELSKLFETN